MPKDIDTGKVKERRRLRFESIEACLAEVNQLNAAERAGRLEQLGNWTLGQTLGHLADWINYGFDGTPMQPLWLIKVFMRTFIGKRRFINDPMRAGVKIPGVKGGTLATSPLATDDGMQRYRTAWERLAASGPALPHLLFGPMTQEEWTKLHLRHAELHLGFLRVRPGA